MLTQTGETGVFDTSGTYFVHKTSCFLCCFQFETKLVPLCASAQKVSYPRNILIQTQMSDRPPVSMPPMLPYGQTWVYLSRGLTLRNQCPESKTPLSQGRRVPMISFALHFTYLKAVKNISLHLNFSRFLQKWHPILPYNIIHTSINDILKQCMIFLQM